MNGWDWVALAGALMLVGGLLWAELRRRPDDDGDRDSTGEVNAAPE